MGSYRALWWRIVAGVMLVLLVLVNLPLWVLGLARFSRGPELTGGYSIVFAIQYPSAQSDCRQMTADLAKQEKRLEQAKTDQEKKSIQEAIGRLKDEITRRGAPEGDENLAERMTEILKERIDPQGLVNIRFRPVDSNHIEIRMPAPGAETRRRQADYDNAMLALSESNISSAQTQKYLNGAPEQRGEVLTRLTEPQKKVLLELGEAFDDRNRGQIPK